MIRASDWQSKLDSFLNDSADNRFMYGRFDCCLFVCDAIHAMTGVDPARDFRERYTTRKSAMDLAKQMYGRASVLAIATGVTKGHGMEPCPVMMARRGDLIAIKRPRDYSLGIVDLTGQHVVVLTHKGIERTPLESGTAAWHV